jgi:hypothetical protein
MITIKIKIKDIAGRIPIEILPNYSANLFEATGVVMDILRRTNHGSRYHVNCFPKINYHAIY